MTSRKQEKQLHSSVDTAVTHAINRLHDLEGDDRLHYLMEWMEFLIYEWDELDVEWLKYMEYQKGLI